MKWNRLTLLESCEELLRRDDLVIKWATVNEKNTTAHFVADVNPEGWLENIVITVDPAQGGLIECVLHECLHIVLQHHVADHFNSMLEEEIVKALERNLWTKGIANAGKVRLWKRLIKAKIQ